MAERATYLYKLRRDLQGVKGLVSKVPAVPKGMVDQHSALHAEAVREALGQEIRQQLQHLPVGLLSLQVPGGVTRRVWLTR